MCFYKKFIKKVTIKHILNLQTLWCNQKRDRIPKIVIICSFLVIIYFKNRKKIKSTIAQDLALDLAQMIFLHGRQSGCFRFMTKSMLIAYQSFSYFEQCLCRVKVSLYPQKVGWGLARRWAGAELGQLTPAGQKDISKHITSRPAINWGSNQATVWGLTCQLKSAITIKIQAK